MAVVNVAAIIRPDRLFFDQSPFFIDKVDYSIMSNI